MEQRTVLNVKTPDGRYKKILAIVSGLMEKPLSEKDIDLVDMIHRKGDVLTTEVRKEIREELDGMSVDHFNNYVSRLRKKGIIDENDRLAAQLADIKIEDLSKPHYLLFVFQPETELPHEGSDQGNSEAHG